MIQVLGVDISNYSAVPTAQQKQCWVESGVRKVCIGLQNSNIARAQQAACHGLEREYYVDVPGRDLTIPEPGSVVWVDVEPGCFQTVRQIQDVIVTLEVNGLIPYIYGNQTSISPVIGNSTFYSKYPLAYANYRHDQQPPDFNSFVPFNGWVRPKVWQYAGTVDLCGINVDLDAWEEEGTLIVNLNVDGSQRIVGEGNQIVFYNGNVPVMVIGDEAGSFPGQVKKNFGGIFWWLRSNLTTGRTFWSKVQGD